MTRRDNEVAVVRGTLTCVTHQGNMIREVLVAANLYGEIYMPESCQVIESHSEDLWVQDFFIEVKRSHWEFLLNAINEARADRKPRPMPPIIVVPCSEPSIRVIKSTQPPVFVPAGHSFGVS